jgi:hypothetical protein
MARLAAELLEADLVEKPAGQVGRLRQLSTVLRGRNPGPEDACLLLCPAPEDLRGIVEVEGWRSRFKYLFAWIFDGFWIDHIPRFVRSRRIFDHVFVTEEEDLEAWKRALGCDVTWLPWGTDVLRMGSARSDRPLDVQRVGRQPPEWEDDARTKEDCQAAGLRFNGRPEAKQGATENQRHLMEQYSRAKFIVSFTNRVSPGVGTHPVREYITGRWVDALGAGAVVAGIPPDCRAVRELLWPEGLLKFDSARREEGISQLREATRAWTPAIAERNHRLALERLDWRWRFEQIAAAAGRSPGPLRRELDALRRAAATPTRTPARLPDEAPARDTPSSGDRRLEIQ